MRKNYRVVSRPSLATCDHERRYIPTFRRLHLLTRFAMSTVIEVDDVWKKYRLGIIGTGTLRHDFERWWHRVRGKPDPYSKVDQRSEIRNRKSELATNVDHRISGVSASLGDDEMWALRGVSFEVKQGEILGIIGRNGAGKSTLLKILSRVTAPTSGEVRVKGRIASLLEVGTGFHPELTGRENVFLNGAILGMTKAEIRTKLDEIVAFAGIDPYLDTPVKRYSSGMYVRLAFAVAAHLDPEILIVDEVLAVGDAEFQKKCLGKMKDVARGGRTVLFVSHNMGAVEQLCSRALLFKRGNVASDSCEVSSVVREYLFARGDSATRAEWHSEGTEFITPWFTPHRFRIVDSAGATLRVPLANNADAWVEFEAEIEQLDPALTVGYAIYSETGNLLYWSYYTDGPQDQHPQVSKGRNVFRSPMPRRLLNEGVYRVELIGSLHYRNFFLEPGTDVPFIYFRVQGGLSDSPFWNHKRPGLLAPVLPWEVKR